MKKKVYEVPVPVVDYGNLCVAEHITLRGVGGRNSDCSIFTWDACIANNTGSKTL